MCTYAPRTSIRIRINTNTWNVAGRGQYSEPLEKINNDRNFTKYLNATGITTAACSIVALSLGKHQEDFSGSGLNERERVSTVSAYFLRMRQQPAR